MNNLRSSKISLGFLSIVFLIFLIPLNSYSDKEKNEIRDYTYLQDLDLIDLTNDHILVKYSDHKNNFYEDVINQETRLLSYQLSTDMQINDAYLIITPIPFFR